jgi:hypothetical protein
MNVQIVELAAWIIVGKFCFDAFMPDWKKRKDDRRRSLEAEAVHAEYHDSRTSTQRQNDLLLRYPQYLVSAPDSWFMQKAIAEQRNADLRSRVESVDIAKKTVIIWIVIGIVALVAWSLFTVLSGTVALTRLPNTPPGAGTLLLIDVWAAYMHINSWKRTDKRGRLAALLVGASTIPGAIAVVGICIGTPESVTDVWGITAALLFAFGEASWSISSDQPSRR